MARTSRPRRKRPVPHMSARAPARPKRRILLLVGTRKGAWIFSSDGQRRTWKVDGPHFLGSIVHHVVLDPRDGHSALMAARTGHLGPTVFRSTDQGRSWKEAQTPPAFPKAAPGDTAPAVDHVFWLTPGHPSQRDVWFAGTSPAGLFRSEDGGRTWAGVGGFNDNLMRSKWVEGGGGPDGQQLHSILVDPRDPGHMYLSISIGGTFESLDAGQSWRPLNKGVAADFLPVKDPEYGHDPHCVVLHPANPDRLYQQNHCGIYRLDRSSDAWIRIGNNMPRKVGDIGFPIVVHPRALDTVWVFPMDGSTVWPRTAIGGKPAVYRTRNGGRTWERLDGGLPRAQAWLTVKRQAFVADTADPVGLYFGTTSGELWASRDEGRTFACIARHLPHVYSLHAAVLDR